MRQILESLPPVIEMLLFIMFFMLLFSMLGLYFSITIFTYILYYLHLYKMIMRSRVLTESS